MKPAPLITAVFVIATFLLFGCTNTDSPAANEIATDPSTIALGSAVFDQKCSGCHNFKQDGIGPNLSGITRQASAVWIKRFIKNPQAVLDAGDARAHGLLKKYATVMPAFASLTNNEVDGVVAYVHAQNEAPPVKRSDPLAITNPIPEPIPRSNIVVGVALVAQVPPSGSEEPLTRIIKLDHTPDNKQMFVLDQRGLLYVLHQGKPVVYLDMVKQKPAFISQPGMGSGFGSFAFHPNFAQNGLFYTTHTEAPHLKKADFRYPDSIKVTLQWVLTEWKAKKPGAIPFEGTSRELLRINMVSGIHGVQEITFHPYAKKGSEAYGLLYIGVGDGGSVENGYPFLVHRTDRVWGTILRIDPQGRNSANKQYGVPSQNPFANSSDPNTVREIYAYGFRNPNRITWSRSGHMLVTNIGQAHIESLDVVLEGRDYGWPLREGTFALHPSEDLNAVYSLPARDGANVAYPVAQYDHDEGKAISGGYEYTGTAVPELQGKYLFGDVPSGRLFYVDMRDLKSGRQATINEWQIALNGKMTTLKALCANGRADLHFGRDKQGEIYLLTKPDGKIYKLVRTAKIAS